MRCEHLVLQSYHEILDCKDPGSRWLVTRETLVAKAVQNRFLEWGSFKSNPGFS